MNRSSSLRLPLLGLGLLLICGIANEIRKSCLTEPLWIDERHTLWTVQGSWGEILSRAAWGNQPAGYFVMLKDWLEIFESDFLETESRAVRRPAKPSSLSAEMPDPWAVPLRKPSYWTGMSLIVLVGVLVFRGTHSVSASLAASIILAFDPTSIAFSVEARPYAGVMFLALLQIFCLGCRLGVIEPKAHADPWSSDRLAAWRWPTIALSIALPWWHYTAALVLVAEVIATALVWYLMHRSHAASPSHSLPPRRKTLMIEGSVVAIGLIPLAWPMSQVASHRSQWSAFVTGSTEQWQPMASLAVATLLLPLLAWGVDRRPGPWRPKTSLEQPGYDSSRKLGVVFFATAMLGVWGLAAIATYGLGTPLVLDRYLVATWPWGAWLAGMVLGQLHCDWLRPTAAGIVSLAVIVNPDVEHWYETGSWPTYRAENWHAAMERIELSDESWPVFSYASLIEDSRLVESRQTEAIDYLKFPLVGLPRQDRIIPCASVPEPLWPSSGVQRIEEVGGGHLVVRDDPRNPQRLRWLAERVSAALQDSPDHYRIDTEAFGAVFLMTIRRTPPPAESVGP